MNPAPASARPLSRMLGRRDDFGVMVNDMALEIEPVIEAGEWQSDFDAQKLAHACIEAAASHIELPESKNYEVCVIFTSDTHMRELNLNWRKLDKPTNVLSFPTPESGQAQPVVLLGDIFIGYETVHREAVEQGKTFRDHTAHMIVHGFLHLNGYDHEDEQEAQEMESEEIAILAALGVNSPYEGDWRPDDAA